MPRTVEITVPSERSDALIAGLREVGTLSLRVHRGASLQPDGDVVAVDVTNRKLAAVMGLADRYGAGEDPAVSLSTSRPSSLVSAGSQDAVLRDTTTSTPEEVELAIGRESTMTAAKAVVMAVAGFVAGIGLASGSLHLVIGAMVIAPGFEPFSRFALGIVRGTKAWQRGLHDVGKGYAALAAGAAVAAAVSAVFGAGALDSGTNSYLSAGSLHSYFSTTTWTSVAIAVVAGTGGAVLLVTNRRVLTAGVMIALGLIPSLSLAAMSLVAGDLSLALSATGRWLVDAVAVTLTSVLVFGWHRRVDGRQVTG